MSELYGIVSLGGTVIGASLNQRGLKGETGATGATGNGIASISKTGSSGLIDTYTITYTNGNTATFTVTNGQDGHSPIITASKSGKTTSVFLDGTKIAEIDDGVGIDSIYKTGSSGLDPVVDEYTILYDDGNYTTFTVTNGKKGDKGDPQSPYTSTPNMDGVGSAGSSSNYSRGDHVHPSDTTKVDKVAGKGLSENDFTDSLKTKLDGIASGAEVNVQSDWNQSTNTADDYIKNKPDLSVYAPLASPSLTGTPTAPTATEGTNTTQIATTAFVKTADDAVKGMLKDALPTDTASGAIASFPDGSDLFDYLSCVVDIEPVQDLHGYDKPWVGGAGKNKLDFSKLYQGTFDLPVQTNLNNVSYDGYIQLESGAQYTWSAVVPQGGGRYLRFYDSSKTELTSERINDYSSNASITFTMPSGATYVRIMWFSNVQILVADCAQSQIELGSTATSWTPYSNICPISGHDEVGVSVVGKNLAPKTPISRGQYIGNTWGGNTTRITTDYIRIEPNTNYYMQVGENNTQNLAFINYNYFDENKTWLGNRTTNSDTSLNGEKGHAVNITDQNVKYIRITLRDADNASADIGSRTLDGAELQLAKGTTRTTYEPYNGQTYTATLPSTTYGGTLDLVSGVLTVDRASVDLGTLNWVIGGLPSSQSGVRKRMRTTALETLAKHAASNNTQGNIICSIYSVISYKGGYDDVDILNRIAIDTDGDVSVFVAYNDYETAADFKSAMSGKQLVYEIATPQTYQLTPQQIDTLKGQNNVWADCGNVEVQYKADVQMYIEKHITVYNGGVS